MPTFKLNGKEYTYDRVRGTTLIEGLKMDDFDKVLKYERYVKKNGKQLGLFDKKK